ncbi:MAG: DUF6671 family protein [Candidatus Sericytochromatia bacterium]|nr:DUF6671 family protein [Candidatus Sericytochromatia bacterium]MEB3221383.1 DUF6671 family protein [Candidatus Sericytochromatia bacterium]
MPTRHGKVELLAPLLWEGLGLRLVGVEDLDTDAFGTFTGEVPRPGGQLETARAKAEAALARTGADLALASEGSFGPHPAAPFLQADRELLVLVDRATGLELVGAALSPSTNLARAIVSTREEALAFAERVGFPSHGLIVRDGPDAELAGVVAKGLATRAALEAALELALPRGLGRAVAIETDMRAHLNPTRQAVIRQAAGDLVARALSHCGACGAPGFAVVEVQPGLPCGWCGEPTRQPLAKVEGCVRCEHTRRRPFPAGERTADPGRCELCNP